MTTPLAKPDDLAVWLGVPANDPQLLAALHAASARFRGAVRHPVTPVAGDTAVLDGDGSASLVLPAAPVTAVATVTVDGDDVTDTVVWSKSGRLRRRGGVFPDGLSNVIVTYDHGFDPIPDEIAEVVIDQARTQYLVRPGLTQVTTSVETVSFGPTASVGVTAQWSAIVDAYKLNRGDRC